MIRTTESLVDILRRSGPGALSASRARTELMRCRPPIVLTPERLRHVVDESEGRIRLMELRMDDLAETVLDSWVVLMDPVDRPAGPGLPRMLWESLATLAAEADPSSRMDAVRWILLARQASDACMAAARPMYPEWRQS